MNCSEFDKIVHELDRLSQTGGADGQSTTSEAALAHAESCSRCAKLLTEVEALNFGLRAIAQHDAQQEAPARLEALLLQSLRQQRAPRRASMTNTVARVSGAQVKSTPWTYTWYAVALGAAALVLFALGAVRAWLATGAHNRAPNPVEMTAGTPAGTKKPLTMGHPIVTTAPHNPAGASTAATQSAQSPVIAIDDATAFYALPFADDPTSLDGGAVIRVSVPRSELAGWGLPVSGVEGAGPIPADLLVSADGTPQAIRLVSQTNE